MRTSIRVMLRQLALGLLSACLVILPMSAYALGFGNIHIKSALNAPLDAEIELLSATTSDLKGLSIKLASREAFLRAGVERPDHLSQLKFTIKQRSNGRAYLQVITTQAVREPFLDFLLEMNWKNGRMLREYTVLLDPPDSLQQQPTLVESAQTESPAVVAKQEQQETTTPFVEPEAAIFEEDQAEPVAAEEIDVADDSVIGSIAAADEEEELVPFAESLSEDDLQFEEEPVAIEDISIAQESDGTVSVAEESADESYVDPFAGEKFPRIPINVDKRLRKAEEAKLANLSVELDLAVERALQVEESFNDEDSLTEEPRQAEFAPLAEEPVVSEELTALTEEDLDSETVNSVKVKRDDKLWNIAESIRSDESVSIYQVMMALLQNNPEAFIEGNVHRLKVGKVLRIEDPALLSAMSKSLAAQEYIAQTQDWESYRQQVADSYTPMQAEMAGNIASTEILPEDAQSETTGELVLSAPEGDNQSIGSTGEQKATVDNEVVILREEIRQALVEAEAEGNKNVILNEKLRDLESQLQGLQRSVTVQDDELATLQKQLSDLNRKNIEAEQVEAAASYSEIPEAVTSPEPVDSDNAVMSEAELLAQLQPEVPAEQPMIKSAPDEQAPTAVAPDSGSGFMDKSFAVLESIKRSLSGMISSLPVSPLILAIGAGVIVVLLLLMLLLVQRRRQAANFQESILSGIPSHEIMASEDASMETNLSGESSFLSDFAISGASALQGDDGDVDPLTEADVFMAYGRYEAAEERILEAIKNDPDRQELRIKLLELYNTTKNKSAFESAAEELYTNLGNDASSPLWQKVVAMGTILAVDNPLFSDLPVNDVTRIRNKPETNSEDILDLGFEGRGSTSEPLIDDLGLDLDFGSDNKTEEASAILDFDMAGEKVAQDEEIDGLDLKFDSDESVQIDTSDFDFEKLTGQTAEVSSLELALDVSGEDTAQTEVALDVGLPNEEKTAEVDIDGAFDFDMSEFDNDISGLDLQLNDNHSSSLGLTLDMDLDTAVAEQKDEGLTMEMSQPTHSEIEMPTMEAEVDATDIADLDAPSMIDEVGTKLDLAKAYIDMGDPDGAKSILDEVLDEGTAPQQQEAQQLMQQI